MCIRRLEIGGTQAAAIPVNPGFASYAILPPPTRLLQIQSEGLLSFAEYPVAYCGEANLRSRDLCFGRGDKGGNTPQ